MLSLSATQHAFGDVNMKDASYFKTWIDHVIQRDRRDLNIRRTYKSRSLHHGLFGFGWCSDLDANINILDASNIELNDCRLERPLHFTKEGNTYVAERNRHDIMILNDREFSRKLNGITTQRFAPDGKQIHDPNLIYKITLNETNQITELIYSDLAKFKYHYVNNDLVRVENENGLLFQYEYDELHNLTLVKYSDGSKERLTYNKDHDQVLSYQARNSCVENYQYEMPDPLNENYFSSTVIKKCAGADALKSKYEFWHRADTSGRRYLDRVRISAGQMTTNVTYNPVTGFASRLDSANQSRTAAFEKSLKGELHDVYQPSLPRNN